MFFEEILTSKKHFDNILTLKAQNDNLESQAGGIITHRKEINIRYFPNKIRLHLNHVVLTSHSKNLAKNTQV